MLLTKEYIRKLDILQQSICSNDKSDEHTGLSKVPHMCQEHTKILH